MTTTLDEYHATHRASLEEKAKGTDGDAVYARLALRLDVINVQQWGMDEVRRGTHPKMLHDALATVTGNMLINFIGASPDPLFSTAYLLRAIRSYLEAGMTGEIETTAVTVDMETGQQNEVTIGGLFAERIAEALKARGQS